MAVPSCAFTKSALTSASAAEAIILCSMNEAVWSGPLGVGGLEGVFEISGG